jgi:hypothetical protein
VLANAYRIFDEKVEKCVPCEITGAEQERNAAAKKKAPAARKTKRK